MAKFSRRSAFAALGGLLALPAGLYRRASASLAATHHRAATVTFYRGRPFLITLDFKNDASIPSTNRPDYSIILNRDDGKSETWSNPTGVVHPDKRRFPGHVTLKFQVPLLLGAPAKGEDFHAGASSGTISVMVMGTNDPIEQLPADNPGVDPCV